MPFDKGIGQFLIHKHKTSDITGLTTLLDAKVDTSGDTMTGQLDAEAGVLLNNSFELDAKDVSFTWATDDIFASAFVTNGQAISQDDTWFYFAGNGGYFFRVNKADTTIIESTPVTDNAGTAQTIFKITISNDYRFAFLGCDMIFAKVDLGSFGVVAKYQHDLGMTNAMAVLCDDVYVYLCQREIGVYRFVQETFTFNLQAYALSGAANVRGGAIVGTNMYVINSASPSSIWKIDLTDTTLSTVTTLTLTGNNTAYNCVHSNGFLYVVHRLSPTKVSKVNLTTFTLTGTKTLTSQNTGQGITTDDIYLYISHFLSPHRVTRLLLSDFLTTSTLTASTGFNQATDCLVYNGNVYSILTNSTYSVASTSSFASLTIGRYGASAANFSLIAGRKSKYFACSLNSQDMFYVDFDKKVSKYLRMPAAVACMTYDAEHDIVYAIDTNATSASIMFLDPTTGKYTRTITPGFTHTSAFNCACYLIGGVLLLGNGTADLITSYDIVTFNILAEVTNANFHLVTYLRSNANIVLSAYGLKGDGGVFKVDYAGANYVSYGSTGLADQGDDPIHLANNSAYLIFTGKNDERVVFWDTNTSFATKTTYSITTVNSLSGSVFSDIGTDDLIITTQSWASTPIVSVINRSTGLITYHTANFSTGSASAKAAFIESDASDIIQVFCSNGNAFQLVTNTNEQSISSGTSKPLISNNSSNAEPSRFDLINKNYFGNSTATTIIQGFETIVHGVLRPLAGIVGSGLSVVTGYVKYLITEYLKVEDKLQVGRSGSTYGSYLDVSSTGTTINTLIVTNDLTVGGTLSATDNDSVVHQIQSHSAVIMYNDEVVSNNDEIVTL